MRIRPSVPSSMVDSTGAAYYTHPLVLAGDAQAFARGPMGSGDALYQQATEAGEGTTWAPLGDFPAEVVAILTMTELSLCSPSASEPNQLRVWGRWERPPRPSGSFEGGDEGVSLPWVSTPPERRPQGLFPGLSDLNNTVCVTAGCVWVQAAAGVTCLDFCTDLATYYQSTGGRQYTRGLLPALVPDDAFGDLLPSLAAPCGPFRTVAAHCTLTHSWAVLAGDGGATLVRKDLGVGGVMHLPVETVAFPGFYPWDSMFLPNGAIVLVGTDTSAGEGRVGWVLRQPVTGGSGEAAWSTPQWAPEGTSESLPHLATEGRWVWIATGPGRVWRLSEPVETLSSAADMELWATIHWPEEVADVEVEALHTSLYPTRLLTGFGFDRGYPYLLGMLTEAQNTLLCVYSRDFSRPLWRRLYANPQVVAVTLPSPEVASPPVVLGVTRDPATGYGPSDTEA